MILHVKASIAVGIANGFPDVGGLIRFDSPTPHRQIDQTTGEQGVVADLFCIQSNSRSTGIETIVRVSNPDLRQQSTMTSKCVRRQQQFHELFGVPARLAKLDRQPIEQLGVTWELPPAFQSQNWF